MLKRISLSLCVCVFALSARADEPTKTAPPVDAPMGGLATNEQAPTPEELKAMLEQAQKQQAEFNKALGIKHGPLDGDMGIATIKVAEGFTFTDGTGAKKWGELTTNPVSGKEIGLVGSGDGSWLVLFEFDDVGYVKDDDKDELDADALLASIREGTNAFNKHEREPRGLPPINIVGFEMKPTYNEAAHVLEWAVIVESAGEQSVNFNTRVLGRRGVVMVTLMFGGELKLADVLPQFRQFMAQLSFKQGETYAEYKEGDKLAQYGLATLVAGGGVALAAKSGLLSKAGAFIVKFAKIFIVGGIALAGGVASFVKRLFNRNG